MSDVKDAQERAIRAALRDERARDATRALQEHEAKKEADLAKTARLRALRLAKTTEAAPQRRK
jgi:hypothetical protein